MMEYRRVSVVRLAGSASLIHRNLCVARGLHSEGSISYAVAHKATANIVHVAEGASTQQEAIDYETTKDKDTMAFLTQVKWCHLKNQRTVLVLTSYKGFQILEWSSKNELYMNKFETPPGSFVCRFTRGVATIGDLVCVGTSDGPILMLNVPAQGSSVTITRQLKGHTVPITDLATNSEGHLASCDESGCIMVWQDPLTSDESSLVIEDAGEVPCMCLCFWENLLIGGFTNGQIVIYNSDSGAKAIEIGAHARSITSLDVAPDSGLLLSVSEDGTASVWRLEPGSDIKVTHLFSVTTTNTLLCGGQFCDAEGSEFALTGYDSAQVVLYSSSRKPPTQPTD